MSRDTDPFKRTFLTFCLTVGLLLSTIPSANLVCAEDWTQFRGPSGQGFTSAKNLPVEFSDSQNVKWRVPIEGVGWSSPVISDNRIWLTTALTQAASAEEREKKLANQKMADQMEVVSSLELKALCIDAATGKTLHNISLAKFTEVEPIHSLNSYASPTPVIDGDYVICDFGNYGTWCLDAKTAETVWSNRIVVDYSVGAGSSPYVLGDILILVCDGIDDQFVVGLNKKNGEEVWRTQRPPMDAADVEMEKAYSTPIAVNYKGQTQIVIPAAQWICAYEPTTGREIWRARHGNGFSLSPTPIALGDKVVFSTGYMRADLVAVQLGGEGDVTDTHIQWRSSRGVPNKPSPIAVDDRIYMISDSGILTQLRAEDGSIVFQQRLGGNYSASPILAGDRLYFSSHEGVVTVVEPGDEYHEIAENQLEGRLMASPAVLGDDLVIRSEFALLRIGE